MTNAEVIENTSKALSLLVQALVADKDNVRISATTSSDQSSTTFAVSVGFRDVGKVVGRSGRTARSIRILIGAIGNEAGLSFRVDTVSVRQNSSDRELPARNSVVPSNSALLL